VCVTDDSAGMRELIHARLGANDRFPSHQRVLAREGVTGLAELSLVGSADDVSRRLDSLAASGVSDFAAHIIGNTAARDATWDFLAAHAQQ
jgi:5,10-methylenetetrahydromethanopterin reductase